MESDVVVSGTCAHRSASRWPHCICFALVLLLLTACTSTSPLTRDDFTPGADKTIRLLVMQPDVELAEITVGGLTQPKADWSEQGLANVNAALAAWMVERGLKAAVYDDTDVAVSDRPLHLQIQKLHGAVGSTILLYGYGQTAMDLPRKDGRFDWTLGDGVAVLREHFDADYALFVYMRDSFATGGRVAMGLALIALGAIVNPGGAQLGFASLVDLHTGDVVWFNRLYSQAGDLREPDAALSSIRLLLKDNPL